MTAKARDWTGRLGRGRIQSASHRFRLTLEQKADNRLSSVEADMTYLPGMAPFDLPEQRQGDVGCQHSDFPRISS